MARSSAHGTMVRAATMIGVVLLLASVPAVAQENDDPRVAASQTDGDQIADHVAAAARRFDIPAAWIWAVMRAESAGDMRAISSAGAMGLMQIMPKTWEALSARYGLGDDPYDPRDNIMAGTAYLREMFDRFGSPGFLAAYNAGPGRYEDHLKTGRRLPAETRAYLAKLAPAVGAIQPDREDLVLADASPWTSAPLFVVLKTRVPADTGATGRPSVEPPSDRPAPPMIVADLSPPAALDDLFVRRSAETSSP